MRTDILQQDRLHLIDAVRGICITGMVFYHALVDVIMLFGITVPENVLLTVNIIRDFGASCFIFLSGFCFLFGRRRLKRFILLFSAGAAVTAVTRIIMPESYVIFGILTFMAVSGGIAAVIQPLLKRINATVGLIFSFVLFLLFLSCFYGYVGYYGLVIAPFPVVLYQNYFTAFFGFPFYGFVSSDYYPLLPWMFMYLFGYFTSRLVNANSRLTAVLKRRVPFFCTVGRYSFYIYLAHQPLIYGALFLVNRMLNG